MRYLHNSCVLRLPVFSVRKMSKTFKITFGGILAAFSVIVLMLGNIPFAEYIGPTFAGLLLVWSVIEMGALPSLCIYAAASVLSFFLSGNKEPVMLYIAFFGYYPMLKYALEKYLKLKVLQWIIKFAVFNAAMVGAYLLLVYVFGMPLEDMGGLGKYTMYILLGAGNVLLVLFDFCIKRITLVYKIKWQKRVHKMMHIKDE